jgi:hypothetical protein
MPFQKTPANLLARATDYSVGSVLDAIAEGTRMGTSEFNQRAFMDALGRTITGGGLIYAGYDMAKSGMATGKPSDNKNVRELERLERKQDYAFKIGDKYHTYDWAQPGSLLFAIGADIYESGKTREDVDSIIFDAIKSGGQSLLNQSLFRNVEQIFKYGGLIENLDNVIYGGATQFVPLASLTRSIADLSDGGYKETRDSSALMQNAINRIKAGNPLLDDELPPRYDILGNPVMKYDGENTLFNVLLNPGFTTTQTTDPLVKELVRLKDLGYTEHIPTPIGKYENYTDDKGIKKRLEFDNRDISRYQYIKGKLTADMMNDIINDEQFYDNDTITDEEKAIILQKIRNAASREAKNNFLIEKGIYK